MREENTWGKEIKRDISSKKVLGNPILYAQFLRNNVNIPFLKDVQPEDIEDVSERYIPYLGTEFESDTVKRVNIHKQEPVQEPLFLISLTEHKSRVDYDVSMQLLKYMLCIWLDYKKEMEQKKEGASNRKGFRYPLIIPIVYYEGKALWTAERRFHGRVSCGETFRSWVPDFTYEVVRLHDYSNEELLARGDEMSLIMLFNKIQSSVELSEFLKLPQEKLDDIVRDTPEAVLDIIVSVMESLCTKIGTTEEEMQECVSRVRERRMGYLFENIEKMDIQAERRNTAQARLEAQKAREEARVEIERVKKQTEKAVQVLKADMEKDMVRSLVATCRELGATKEMTVEKVVKNCGMEEKEAAKKVDMYWKIEEDGKG